jgi:HD-GYP domain-containing protein (c-di-GMP phosphodiesterase class II)
MADNLQITKASSSDSEMLDTYGREHSEKLQTMARGLVSALYMLVRSVKMYDPDNSVFEKPLAQLQDTINQIIRKEGKLELMGVKQSFYLNGMLVKVDMASLDNVKYLLDELRAKDVGGFTMLRSVTVPELKNFIWIFSKDQPDQANEDGTEGKKLVSMKLAKWSKLKDKLEKEKDESELRLDRKKYALTCYGRAIFFIKKYMESLRVGKPLNTSKSLRIIQDFVDISMDHRTHFLGLTTTRVDSEYLSYHQVNSCLMAIVFGNELGLTKIQLRDLGYIALFHDAGMGTVPDNVLNKRGALSADEKALIARAPLVSIRNILREKAINRSTLLRLVTTFEHKVEFGTAVRDGQGNIQMIIPKANLGLYAKIISITATYDALTSKRAFRDAYGPEVALMLMWTEMRNKFDPDLLKVFMRVMAIQPIKVLTKRQQSLSIGII